MTDKIVVIRGAGDLASGVAIRLRQAGYPVLMTEVSEPRMVRSSVSFAEAVYQGWQEVDGLRAELCQDYSQAVKVMGQRVIPVLIDPELTILRRMRADVVVDARMTKKFEANRLDPKILVIGLGPGFVAGENCKVVIETNRGPNLGQIIWEGQAEADTGVPGVVSGRAEERVYFSPGKGVFIAKAKIGEVLNEGQVIGKVDEEAIVNRFKGLLRGCLHSGLTVMRGEKLADVDPRLDFDLVRHPSDKAYKIGDGVVTAIRAG